MAGRETRRRASVNYSITQLEQQTGTPAWLGGKRRRATTAGDLERSQNIAFVSETKKAKPQAHQSRKDVAVTKAGKQRKSTSQSRDTPKKSPRAAKQPVRTRASDEGTPAVKPAAKPGRANKASQSTAAEPEKRPKARGAPPASPPAPAAAPPRPKPTRRSAPSPTAAPAASKGGHSQKVTGSKRGAKAVAEEAGQGASKRRRSVPETEAATQSGEPPLPPPRQTEGCLDPTRAAMHGCTTSG